MSFLVNLLNRGESQPHRAHGWGGRLGAWLGLRLARRNRAVEIGPGCSISPAALIHPRKSRIRIGAGSMVSAGAIVQGNVRIGARSSVQNYAVIVGYGDGEEGRVTIGDDVRIAPHCMLLGGNHVFRDPDRPVHGQGMDMKPIVIEDGVWIAGRVNVTAGVRIGRGAIIGAGAVVTRDIPPMSVAAGVPARVIRRRGNEEKRVEGIEKIDGIE